MFAAVGVVFMPMRKPHQRPIDELIINLALDESKTISPKIK